MNKALKTIVITVVIIGVAAAAFIYGRYGHDRKKGTDQEPVPNEQTDGDQAKDNGDRKDNGENGADEPGDATDGTGGETGNGGDGSPIDGIDKELLYDENGIIKPEYAEKIIREISDKVILALRAKDAQAISDFVRPVKGLRFTPYTSVDLKQDPVFSKKSRISSMTIRNTCGATTTGSAMRF